mmetsp:Transcript_54284/g.94693  ORF Transcript_54284/g.94693 Transcript_54284/m.94693 type:complete len:303 (+) Transcript_54284:111-1019(+)
MRCFTVRFVSRFEHWGHTVYRVEVSLPTGKRWLINKRYSEVRELHETLRIWFGDRLPPMPGRKIFGRHDPAFLSERQLGLQHYLSGALKLVAKEPALQAFVGHFLGFEDEQVVRTDALCRGRERERHQDYAQPPATASWGPTAAQHSERSESWAPSTAGAAGHQAENPRMARSATPNRANSFHTIIEESPTPGQRRRRWSRQQRVATPDVHRREPAVERIREEVHRDLPEEGYQEFSMCQSVRDRVSRHASLPGFSFWEWPLSRSEKKLRVELIESSICAIEQHELLRENEMLRTRRKTAVA